MNAKSILSTAIATAVATGVSVGVITTLDRDHGDREARRVTTRWWRPPRRRP